MPSCKKISLTDGTSALNFFQNNINNILTVGVPFGTLLLGDVDRVFNDSELDKVVVSLSKVCCNSDTVEITAYNIEINNTNTVFKESTLRCSQTSFEESDLTEEVIPNESWSESELSIIVYYVE